MAKVNTAERSAKIQALASRFGNKFGGAEVVKLNSIAVVNILIAKGIITDDEYQNELLKLLTQNAAALV